MAPMGLLSPRVAVQSVCASTRSGERWHPQRSVLSGPVLARSPSHSVLDVAPVKSSSPLLSLDFAYGSYRRSRLAQVFSAAIEESLVVDEASAESAVVEEKSATPARKFKPRVVGQKLRREDASVPDEALVPGAVFTGKVTTIQPFGAFVDFGASTDGLVHISKLRPGFVNNVSDVLTLGQEVSVTIINVEQGTGRIGLTMLTKEEESEVSSREGIERPRVARGSDGKPINRGKIAGGGRTTKRDEPEMPATKLVKGDAVEGTVKNKTKAGVFVELADNEEAFLRYSDIPGGENMVPDASSVQVGQQIKATVLKIQRGKAVLTMKTALDISSVNRDINKGGLGIATNPFEIAFRSLSPQLTPN